MKAKNALVTGSSRGIGRAIAIDLAKSGYNIIINYLEQDEEAEKTLKECLSYGVRAIKVKADIRDLDAVKKMFDRILDEFKEIHVLVNNAGIGQVKQFQDYSPEDWYNHINTNVNGMYHCSKFAIENMLKRHEGQIINISSIWGISGGAMEVAYSTSKGAIISFTKALAKEVGYSNIQVNCVAPGAVDTSMLDVIPKENIDYYLEEVPFGRMARPEEIANLVTFLLDEKASYITGQVISINGGFLI